MHKIAKYLTAAVLGIWALALLLLPERTSAAVTQGLHLCCEVLIPSLFPFFVCSDLLCSLGLLQRLSERTQRLMQPLFHVSGVGASAFITGLIGGYPAGARNIAALYSSGQIGEAEASRLLRFCCACGPAFLIGAVGTQVFSSVRIGLILYGIHAAGAVLTGILLRPGTPPDTQNRRNAAPQPPAAFSAAFTASVQKAGASCLQVCMFVVTFCVLSDLLLFLLPDALDLPAAGLLELSSAIRHLRDAPMPQTAAMTLASFFVGFGGLGVYAQTAAVLFDAGLSAKGYLSAKLLHGAISAVLTLIIFSVFPALAGSKPAAAFPLSAPFMPVTVFIWLFCGGICLLFHKVASRNSEKHRV